MLQCINRESAACGTPDASNERSEGGGVHFRCDGSARGLPSAARFARQVRDGWQCRIRRHADAVSTGSFSARAGRDAKALIEIKNGFDLTS